MIIVVYRPKATVDYLTESVIEAKAEKLLRRYEDQEGPIGAPPIPIEFIVTKLLGFEIRFEDQGERQTVGYIDPNSKVICLNEQKSDYLDRIGPEFTWAHEIGHWELGHFEEDSRQLGLGIGNQDTRILEHEPTSSRRPRPEVQADYFASFLLMPKRLLLPLAIKLDLLQSASISLLKERFNVSSEAMKIRLEYLGLIYRHEGRIFSDRLEAQGNRRLL